MPASMSSNAGMPAWAEGQLDLRSEMDAWPTPKHTRNGHEPREGYLTTKRSSRCLMLVNSG